MRELHYCQTDLFCFGNIRDLSYQKLISQSQRRWWHLLNRRKKGGVRLSSWNRCKLNSRLSLDRNIKQTANKAYIALRIYISLGFLLLLLVLKTSMCEEASHPDLILLHLNFDFVLQSPDVICAYVMKLSPQKHFRQLSKPAYGYLLSLQCCTHSSLVSPSFSYRYDISEHFLLKKLPKDTWPAMEIMSRHCNISQLSKEL